MNEGRKTKSCAYCGKQTHVFTENDEIYLCSTVCFYSYCERFGKPKKFRRGYN